MSHCLTVTPKTLIWLVIYGQFQGLFLALLSLEYVQGKILESFLLLQDALSSSPSPFGHVPWRRVHPPRLAPWSLSAGSHLQQSVTAGLEAEVVATGGIC